MSRFIELLEKVGETAPAPLGFAAATGRAAAAPQIVLAARVLAGDLTDGPEVAAADAAALLVETEYPLPDAAAEALKDRLWGVRLTPSPSAYTVEQVEALVEQGCDFVVFESMDTEAAVLNDDDLGKIVTLDADVDEEVGRAVADLPFDAVLFRPGVGKGRLALSDLVAVQRVRRLAGQPFVVEAPEGLEKADVEAMRNLGVEGLIVDVPPAARAEKTAAAIRSLRKRPSRRRRSDALVPGASIEDDDDHYHDDE